jgi:ribose/xylose/arabinose/galactoside ABC-type transport system permease subunit
MMTKIQFYRLILNLPLELIIWMSALLFLVFTASRSAHSSLCPLDNLGFNWCPGCGLGRSIRYLLHGEFNLSFENHWFGIPASIILFYRIIQLFKIFLLNLRFSTHINYGK